MTEFNQAPAAESKSIAQPDTSTAHHQATVAAAATGAAGAKGATGAAGTARPTAPQPTATRPTSNRINAKDLINIGLFTVLYLIVVFVIAMLGYIPIFIPLLAVLVPLAAGIPYMLFLTKVKKFGMVLIQGILVGLFYSLMGMSLWALACTFVCSLLAELVLRTGGYRSAKKAILSYAIVSCWIMGNFLPIFVARNAYYDMIISSNYGTAYADGLMAFMPDWILPVLLASCLVFGILGGLLGKATMRKHFQRAGLA